MKHVTVEGFIGSSGVNPLEDFPRFISHPDNDFWTTLRVRIDNELWELELRDLWIELLRSLK